MKNLILTLVFLGFCSLSFSQTARQTVKGKVVDKTTHETLIGASVILIGSDPIKGATTNLDGIFILDNVPVGRQSLEIRILGYQTYIAHDILVSSGKQVILDIELQEDNLTLDEVVVVARTDKSEATNTMATVSSKQFSVEQTQRYAGGLDDPARLVSSFAGVVNPSLNSNGISVRGNSPSGLLWRIEGVEVPSPNHFANLNIAGAGLLTALSGQVMANSDFYTGAFPAEYGNATSGVFDIKLRNGNSSQREHTLKAGLLGVEFASEGPFKKGKEASYLVNYRYSTLALIGAFLPSDAGVLKYQDLSYKVNLPTENAGTFSMWGVGALDGIDTEAEKETEWKTISDRDNSQMSQYMYVSGLNHKIFLNGNSVINSAISLAGNGLDFNEQRLDNDLTAQPNALAKRNNYKITLQSALTRYFNDKHTNRTGFYFTQMGYDLDIEQAATIGSPLNNMVSGNGQSGLFQFYSASKFALSEKFELNGGIHLYYFALNNELSVEPRIALKYDIDKSQNIALAYGLHSRAEELSTYFVNVDGTMPNKDLKLMKSNHIVLSYNALLTENLKLSVEPYYQYLTNVPVSPNNYISTLNIRNGLFFNETLVSEGTAKNIGVDVTLERFMHNGLYYLFSASVFDSKYTAADGIARNTRFNKNYVINALVGKEWQVGREKNNLFSINLRMNYLGGNRKESIDETSSMDEQEVVYGETGDNISFDDKFPDLPIFSFTTSYRKNKKKYSSVWSLQVLNASQTPDFETDIFNLRTQRVEEKFSNILIPNLSYKIEF